MRRRSALIGLMLLSLPQAVAAQNVVKLATFENPPYTGRHLPRGGLVNQIIEEAYGRVGYRVSTRYYSASTATELAMLGEFDGLTIARLPEARREWFLYSDPLPAGEVVFYKRKDREVPFDGRDYDPLRSFSFGTGPGYADWEVLPDRLRNQTHVRIVNDELQMLRILESGRVDLVVVDKFLAQHLLNTRLPELAGALDWVSAPITTLPSHLGISRKATQAQTKLADFNRGLAMLVREGRIRAILAEHGLRE